MKKHIISAAVALSFGSVASTASAEDIKIGVFLGLTGPLESLVANMAPGAEAAIAEVSASGMLLDGSTVTPVRADTTCVDAAAATAAIERLIPSDKVAGGRWQRDYLQLTRRQQSGLLS